jgi:hypothetical protein
LDYLKQLSDKQFPTDNEFNKLSNFLIDNKELCSTPQFSDHWLSLFPLTLSVPYENKKEKIFISFQG